MNQAWKVVGGGFVAQLFVLGFFTYAVSLLVEPVRAEFGASLEQVMYALTVGTIAGFVLQPVAGVMVDRFSVRWIMAAGTLLYAGGLYATSQTGSLGQYIVLFGLTMALANAFAGSLCASAVISRWFTATRGRALGVAAIGTSLGGVLVPWMIAFWLAEHGWRETLELFALTTLLVMLPVVLWTIRDTPKHAAAASASGGTATATAPPAADALSLQGIIGQPGFWYLGLSLGLLFAAYTSFLANIEPYITNGGGAATYGATLITVIAVSGFIGKLVFGMAADKFNLKAALWTAQGLVILALLLFARAPLPGPQMIAATLLGLAAGGMLPVWGSMMAQLFGLASYGRAMGLMSPLITLCVLPSYPLVGRLVDETGNYTLGLYVAAACTLFGALLLVLLRLPNAEDAGQSGQ
ncbi:MAG: MFS transporter [Halioglobus sp.]